MRGVASGVVRLVRGVVRLVRGLVRPASLLVAGRLVPPSDEPGGGWHLPGPHRRWDPEGPRPRAVR